MVCFTYCFHHLIACRRRCGWFRARLCRPLVTVCSSRSPPLCSSGRTSPCPKRSSRRRSKRCVFVWNREGVRGVGRDIYVWEEKKVEFDVTKNTCASLTLLHKVFGSTMGKDLILEFTKEMFTMKQFEQVSCFCFCLFSLYSADANFSLPPSPPALPPQPVALHRRLVRLRRSPISPLWPGCAGQSDPRQSPTPNRRLHGLWNLPTALHRTDHGVRRHSIHQMFYLHPVN